MIIEIKNLPEGRKVKHINVDISFEEDSSISTQTKVKQTNEQSVFTNISSNEDELRNNMTVVERPQITTERQHKEVPTEMKDLEF